MNANSFVKQENLILLGCWAVIEFVFRVCIANSNHLCIEENLQAEVEILPP